MYLVLTDKANDCHYVWRGDVVGSALVVKTEAAQARDGVGVQQYVGGGEEVVRLNTAKHHSGGAWKNERELWVILPRQYVRKGQEVGFRFYELARSFDPELLRYHYFDRVAGQEYVSGEALVDYIDLQAGKSFTVMSLKEDDDAATDED